MPGIATCLAVAEQQLAGSESPRLDAELLLAHLLGKQRSYLRAFPEAEINADVLQAYRLLLARRAAGEPVAHLVGEREFWSLNLKVTADTLVPRPDTELLVEQALARLPAKPAIELADLGTGSGAIAIAIASECPGCHITATDLSTAALAIAQGNAQQHDLRNIDFVHSNWCSAFDNGKRFDMIVSNPPYIPAADPHMRSLELAHEPRMALVSGEDGLDAIRFITAQAFMFLRPGGWLLVEHGYDQGRAVRDLFTAAGFENIETHCDLAGHERVCAGQRGKP